MDSAMWKQMDLLFWILLLLAAIFIVACDYLRLRDRARRAKSRGRAAARKPGVGRQASDTTAGGGSLHGTSNGHGGGRG